MRKMVPLLSGRQEISEGSGQKRKSGPGPMQAEKLGLCVPTLELAAGFNL